MLSYEVDVGVPGPAQCDGEELYRLEFRAPVTLPNSQAHDKALVWVNNLTRADAEAIQRRARETPQDRQIFCRRCPAGTVDAHDHDALPEEQGWLYAEMTRLRIAPMREAV